jgi:hypothetical protein
VSIEETLQKLLGPLVEGRFYPDVVPEDAKFPAITYHQVGGRAGWYVDRTMPSHKHGRFQINVWAKSRLEASQLARQVENTICASTLIAEPNGAATSLYEQLLALYGTRQDFGIWFPD